MTLLCISFHVNKIISAVFCQAEDHFQKLSIKSSRPYLPLLFTHWINESNTLPLYKSPWHSQTGVLVLWNRMFLARASDYILNLLCFLRGVHVTLSVKPSLPDNVKLEERVRNPQTLHSIYLTSDFLSLLENTSMSHSDTFLKSLSF